MGDMLGAGGEDEAGGRMKKMIYITDSMTPEELDSDGSCFTAPIKAPGGTESLKDADAAGPSKAVETTKDGKEKEGGKKKKEPVKVRMTARARRVARGSGTSVRDVEEFLMQYRMVSNMVKKVGGKQGW